MRKKHYRNGYKYGMSLYGYHYLDKKQKLEINGQPISNRCVICGQWPKARQVVDGVRYYGCGCTLETCSCKCCVMTPEEYKHCSDSKYGDQFSGMKYDWQHCVEVDIKPKRLMKSFKHELYLRKIK